MARASLKGISRLIDNAQNELSAEQAFLDDLRKSIEITANADKRLPSKTIKPSSMNCIRNMWYQCTGVTPEDDIMSFSSVGITNSGSDIHCHIQKAVLEMKKNGFDCEYVNVADYVKCRELSDLDIVKYQDPDNGEYETKLYHKRYNMSFLCDGIIRYKNKYYILEIKSEASFKWYNRVGVDEKHYNQGTAYSLAFDISDVIFVYVNRDIFDMKSYMFIPTADMLTKIRTLIEDCNSYVKDQICPPKPDVSKRVCNYCGYKTICQKG